MKYNLESEELPVIELQTTDEVLEELDTEEE